MSTVTAASAVRRFVASALLGTLVVTAAALAFASRQAHETAVREARTHVSLVTERAVLPALRPALLQGDAEAQAAVATALRPYLVDGSLVHAKVWDSSGRVLWSDEPSLIGRSFTLPPDIAAIVGTTESVAEVSGLTKEENEEEQSEGSLIEVYVGTKPDGLPPLLVEGYLPLDRIDETEALSRTSIIQVAVGSLLATLALLLPLAVGLARRVSAAQERQAALVGTALRASDRERRLVAGDLHDGVLPELASITYALPRIRDEVESRDPESGARLDRVARDLRGVISSLRAMLRDLYPPSLEEEGLAVALDQLAQQAGPDLRVDVTLDDGPDLPLETARLAYRVAREGLRNVVRHSGAAHAQVSVGRVAGTVEVRVSDDGSGPVQVAEEDQGSHLGLRILGDTLREVGGELHLTPGPDGRGAVLRARFPVVGS